jgi:uncharacterized membrane protein
MNMHYTVVPLGQDWFVLKKLKNVNLGLEDLSNWHHVVSVAEDVTSGDSLFISDVDSDLHVFSWGGILDVLSLGIKDSKNLTWVSTWHKSEFISNGDCSIFDLSVDDKILFLHLVKNWDSQWSLRESFLKLDAIKQVNKAWSIVPLCLVSLLLNVVSGHT